MKNVVTCLPLVGMVKNPKRILLDAQLAGQQSAHARLLRNAKQATQLCLYVTTNHSLQKIAVRIANHSHQLAAGPMRHASAVRGLSPPVMPAAETNPPLTETRAVALASRTSSKETRHRNAQGTTTKCAKTRNLYAMAEKGVKRMALAVHPALAPKQNAHWKTLLNNAEKSNHAMMM